MLFPDAWLLFLGVMFLRPAHVVCVRSGFLSVLRVFRCTEIPEFSNPPGCPEAGRFPRGTLMVTVRAGDHVTLPSGFAPGVELLITW